MVSTSLIANYKLLITKIKAWIMTNKLEFVILVLILSIGAYFRLYRISEYMTFLGDEGRDAIIVRRLLVDFDPILIGPRTSIGDMYLGPLYYYLIAPALFIAGFSPAGPSILVALFGIATIFFVWFAGREWFPPKALHLGGQVAWGALIAATLYAISPVVITYSKSSWNPNIMPFFALLSVYSIWKVWNEYKFVWLIVMSVSLAFMLQSHYLGLLLIPTLAVFWLLTLLRIYSNKIGNWKLEIGNLLRTTFMAALLFAGMMSPLVIFDARHGWGNFESMKRFFTERQTTVSARPWTALPKIPDIFVEMITRLVAGTSELMGSISSKVLPILVLGSFLTAFLKKLSSKDKEASKRVSSYFLLFTWLGVALIGLGVYKQEIYDHYYGFFFPVPFLLIGAFVQEIAAIGKKKISFGLFFWTFIIICFLGIANLHNNPLRYSPNRQLQRSIEVSDKIIMEAEGKKFNLAVIAERNYEGAYQYFLEKENAPIVVIDPQREESFADQLFVVCELPREKCDPVNNPKTEIANFGWSKIEEDWQVAGVILYKLVPNI